MNVLKAIELAEIRHGELLEQAEQHRRTQRAEGSRRGGVPLRLALRHALTALSDRTNATRRRLSPSGNLVPAATKRS